MRPFTLACALALVVAPVRAQEVPEWDSREVQLLCVAAKVDDAHSFPAIRAGALEVRRALCLEKAGRSEVEGAYVRFVSELASSDWFSSFGGFSGGRNPFEAVRSQIDLERSRYPTLDLSSAETPELIQSDADELFAPASLSTCDAAAGKDKEGNERTCRDALAEVVRFYQYAQTTLSARQALEFTERVESLAGQWESFLFHSRSETILELAINSAIYRAHEPRQFGPPPSRQLIVLHPELVIENVEEALEGDKTKEALMVEVFGMNWWNQKRWYLPSGISAIALYTDRADIDDVGYGVALHFRGVYTLGFADHGGDGGIFASLDLLKFVQDRKGMLDKYTR